MKRRLIPVLGLLALLGGGWLLRGYFAVGQHRGGAFRKRPPLHVQTVRARVASVPVLVRAVGQVEPERSVAIRPQVSGVLTGVEFAEGSDVSPGQVLFRIDPAPLKAAVAQVEATLARDRASLANARWQLRRLAPLVKLDYVTPQEYETARTAVNQARAAIAADRAQLEQARIKLGYATIRSPIRGRAGAVSVKAGNLVSASGATPLVTINQISPIMVRFTVPQSRLDAIRRFARKGPLTVSLDDGAGTGGGDGRLVFIDNAVDASTGTVTLKAEFPNRSRRLWPGQYVPVKLRLTVQRNAVVVPESAVQPGQGGAFVYTVVNGAVAVQPVTIARQQGAEAIVAHGLHGGETVVSRVPRSLREGLHVIAQPVSSAR